MLCYTVAMLCANPVLLLSVSLLAQNSFYYSKLMEVLNEYCSIGTVFAEDSLMGCLMHLR